MTHLEEYAAERAAACEAWTGDAAHVQATKAINDMCMQSYVKGDTWSARMESEWVAIAKAADFPDFATWFATKYPAQVAA